MSINYGDTFTNPVTLTPSPIARNVTGATSAVTGVSNNAVDVSASLGLLSLSAFASQINNDTIARPNLGVLSTSGISPQVTFTPVQGDVTVDATTAGKVVSGINANAVSQGPQDDDFANRASTFGNIWANNFTDIYESGVINPARAISSTQDLLDDSSNQGLGGEFYERSAVRFLSGGASIDLEHRGTAGSGDGSYQVRTNGADSTVVDGFYVQFSTYYPRDVYAWRYPIGGSTAFKIANFGNFGNGQFVLAIDRWMGFPGGFINGSDNIASEAGSSFSAGDNPWGRLIFHVQNMIDTVGGADYTSSNSKTEWLERYGYLLRGLDDDMDTTCHDNRGSTTYGSIGVDVDPLMYNRTQPSGWPDTRCAGQQLNLDGWTTFECFIDRANNTLRIWQANYNERPVLIFEATNLSYNGTSSDKSQLEILNYDTQRLGEDGVSGGAFAQARPDHHFWCDELIVSSSLIPYANIGGFPYTLPGSANSTALGQALSALSAGGSVEFTGTGLTSSNTEDGYALNWNQRFFYDPVRNLARMWGKEQQSTGSAARHMEYDLDTNAWTVSGAQYSSLSGHIYDAVGYEDATGDIWWAVRNERVLRKWTFGTALDSWNETATSDAGTDAGSVLGGGSGGSFAQSGELAAAWHPNLYGYGDGGQVVMCNAGLAAWRKSTDTWEAIQSYTISGTIDRATACYVRGLDAIICVARNSNDVYRVDSASSVTQVNDMPISPGHATGESLTIIDDPDEQNTCYAFEKASGRRVWKYNNGTWDLLSGQHPFVPGSYPEMIVAPLYGMNAWWGLERASGTIRGRLFKKPSGW